MEKYQVMDKYVVTVGEARPAAGDVPSASPVYRHASAKDGFPELGPKTLFELFEQSVAKFSDKKCLGHRPKLTDGTRGPYEWRTYAQVKEEVALLSSGLAQIGGAPGCKIGVFGGNCPEWMLAMQACNRLNTVCVPLYDSLGENAIEFITNHSEATVVFVASDKLANLAKALPKCTATLKSVVYWGEANTAAIETATGLGFKVVSFADLKQMGSEKPSEAVPPKPEDLCTIMYTSGTTGDPKGVMLTHTAVISGVANAYFYCKANNVHYGEGDAFLSYLPLAHIFDRVNEEFFLFFGGCIGYWQGDVLKLLEDIAALKPAMFVGVPRVFDRIYSRVMGQVATAPFLKRTLFNWGLSRKLHFMRQGRKQAEASPFFDRLVFSKVSAALGGKVKAIVSGGAPLAPHVEDFLRTAMMAPMVQGYGLTETCAASLIASSDVMAHAGTVGPPCPCTEIRLESVPDMNYNALDAEEPKGEVLIRGPANFKGYYKDQTKTDEVLEKDGWFHTGDIAVMTKDGAIKIIDRKKNIFKLSQGEYIAVEKVEAVMKKNLLLEQVWVYGNSFKSCLVAVVVPTQAGIQAWADANGVTGTYAELCANPKAKEHVLAEIVATCRAEKLKGFEICKAILLESKQFTVEDDLLTPTFKLKRPQLQKKYQAAIDEMYKELKE